MVWREGSLSGESRRALLKLRALGATADEPVIGYAPRVRVRDAAFEPLSAALERHVIVRFPYLKPGEGTAREREVIPLALVQYQGRWHLSAEEVASGENKTFLLRRIVGPVTTGKPAPARPGDHKAAALTGLEAVWERNVAEVEVQDGTDAATRLRNRRAAEVVRPGVLRLHFVDLAILADELSGFGLRSALRRSAALAPGRSARGAGGASARPKNPGSRSVRARSMKAPASAMAGPSESGSARHSASRRRNCASGSAERTFATTKSGSLGTNRSAAAATCVAAAATSSAHRRAGPLITPLQCRSAARIWPDRRRPA